MFVKVLVNGEVLAEVRPPIYVGGDGLGLFTVSRCLGCGADTTRAMFHMCVAQAQ